MNGSINSTTITIPARIYYHNLTTPFSRGSNPEDSKYSVSMLISKNDPETKRIIDDAIEAAKEKAVMTKWNGAAPPRPTNPLYDGDDLRANGEPFSPEAAGNYVLIASSRERPEIVDVALQPIVNESDIYRGVYIYASISFYGYARSGKKGIGCAINAVLKWRDGDHFEGGRVTAAQAFAPVIRQLASQDATPFSTDQLTKITA